MANHEPVVKAIGSVLKEHLQRIADQFRAVDQRLDALPQNLADAYQGVHRDGNEYRRGDLLTHQGGLWLVMRDTSDRPGTSDATRLIVKSHK